MSNYTTETNVERWIRNTFGSPFLAQEKVTYFLLDLFPIMPQNEKVDKYRDYLLNNYLSADNRFPVDLWADRVIVNLISVIFLCNTKYFIPLNNYACK